VGHETLPTHSVTEPLCVEWDHPLSYSVIEKFFVQYVLHMTSADFLKGEPKTNHSLIRLLKLQGGTN